MQIGKIRKGFHHVLRNQDLDINKIIQLAEQLSQLHDSLNMFRGSLDKMSFEKPFITNNDSKKIVEGV